MIRAALCIAASTLMLAGCSASSTDDQQSAPATTGQSVEWGYSGPGAPENWGSLSPDFATCSEGTRQSPIAITGAKPVRRKPPALDYRKQAATATNNGHTVEAAAGPGNVMTLDDTEYALIRMHFHSPAETVVDGVTYPVELHFVHESEAGKNAVVAVMIEEGAENPGLNAFVDALGQEVDAESLIDLPWQRMVPQVLTSYRYPGSLTTPDCSEGIDWVVAKTPITASADQIAAFQAAYDDNARPVQPLNGRSVTVDAQ